MILVLGEVVRIGIGALVCGVGRVHWMLCMLGEVVRWWEEIVVGIASARGRETALRADHPRMMLEQLGLLLSLVARRIPIQVCSNKFRLLLLLLLLLMLSLSTTHHGRNLAP